MSDRYQELRARVEEAQRRVIGLTPAMAGMLCGQAGLRSRIMSIDGQGCMITADYRMDRIGLHVVDGIVTEASCG